jgi:ubiquinone/menaquinone biosynthesis C-methylase UbiE
MSFSNKWRSHYNQRAEKYGASAKANDYRDLRQFKILQKITGKIFWQHKNQHILDVGCGNGSISKLIAKENIVYGLDLSLEMLKVAQDRNLIPLSSNALHLPVCDKTVDSTICFGLLQLFEKLDDVAQCMRELHRVTKHEGMLILSTINGESLLQRLLCSIFNIKGNHYVDTYSSRKISQLLEKSGFIIEEMYLLYAPLPFFYSKNRNPGIFNRLFASTMVIKALRK